MRKESGFTLIELMITIAIVAILLGVAVPSFMDFIKNNRRAAAINTFVTDVHLARSEAAKRNERVVICKRRDAPGAPACDNSGDWTNGWLVFVDSSGAEEVLDGTDQVLIIRSGLSSELSMNSAFNVFSFRRFSSTASDSVYICSDNNTDSGRKVVLDRGRPRTEALESGDTC